MVFSPKPKKQGTVSGTMTDALIVSLVADGLTYEQLKQVFPDKNEDELRRVVAKAVAGLGLFPGDETT